MYQPIDKEDKKAKRNWEKQRKTRAVKAAKKIPGGPVSKTIKYYVTVEGNIGCGKSTFLEILKRKIPQI